MEAVVDSWKLAQRRTEGTGTEGTGTEGTGTESTGTEDTGAEDTGTEDTGNEMAMSPSWSGIGCLGSAHWCS